MSMPASLAALQMVVPAGTVSGVPSIVSVTVRVMISTGVTIMGVSAAFRAGIKACRRLRSL